MDVLADGIWEKTFKVKPPVFTREERKEWLEKLENVTLGSDAFFPFFDNIDRARRSGVKYIVQPGGSVRDDAVIDVTLAIGMPATDMAWLWYLQESGCSIIDKIKPYRRLCGCMVMRL